MAPPLLYDLTDLQRHANRLYGFSAQKTLDMAQALYEQHKLISYPRTDSRHLSHDIAETLPKSSRLFPAAYQQHLAPGTGERALGKRYVDDSKVSDHHAIIPTAVAMHPDRLSEEESKIYDLVCRRLLMLLARRLCAGSDHGDYRDPQRKVIDRYRTTGTAVRQTGWKILDAGADARKREPKRDGEPTDQALPGLSLKASHKM